MIRPKENSQRIKRNWNAFSCKKRGHFKKECEGFKEWLNKKGTYGHFFSLEPFDYDCGNSWWFDTASPIYTVNSLQGLSKITIPRPNESKICTANGQALKVQAMGECKLLFKDNYVLALKMYIIFLK